MYMFIQVNGLDIPCLVLLLASMSTGAALDEAAAVTTRPNESRLTNDTLSSPDTAGDTSSDAFSYVSDTSAYVTAETADSADQAFANTSDVSLPAAQASTGLGQGTAEASTSSIVTSTVKPSSRNNLVQLYRSLMVRSEEKWRELWHKETFRRCRQQLRPHIRMACTKDIYRIDKRGDPAGPIFTIIHPLSWKPHEQEPREDDDDEMFLSAERALDMRGRRVRRNIMRECCYTPRGCTWEEYAEYCQNHNRIRVKRSSPNC